MRPYSFQGTPAPQGTSTQITSSPSISAIFTQRCENCPKRDISTLSPGFSVLVIAASHAPVPEPGNIITSPVVVLKTLFRPSNRGSVNAAKSGARMSC